MCPTMSAAAAMTKKTNEQRSYAIPFDTSTDAHSVQTAVYRRLGGLGRLQVMFRLSETVNRLAMSGIRARHPAYTEDDLRRAYFRLRLGDTLTRAIWPDAELVDP
jgi:hypothetical protein